MKYETRRDIEARGFRVHHGGDDPFSDRPTYAERSAKEAELAKRKREELKRIEQEREAIAKGEKPPKVRIPKPKKVWPEPEIAHSRREGAQADYGLEGVYGGSRAGPVNSSGAADPAAWDVLSARSAQSVVFYPGGTFGAQYVYPSAHLLGNLRQIIINTPATRVLDELAAVDEERFPSHLFGRDGAPRADTSYEHPLPGGQAAMRYLERERLLGSGARPGAFVRRTVEMSYEGLVYLMSCRGELAFDPFRMPSDYRESIITAELDAIRSRLEQDQQIIDGTYVDEDADPSDPDYEPPTPMPLEERRRLEALLEGGGSAIIHEWLRDEMRRIRDKVEDEDLTDEMIKNWSYSTLFDYHENVYAAGKWDGLTRIGGGVVRWGHGMVRASNVVPPCQVYNTPVQTLPDGTVYGGGEPVTCHHRDGTWAHPDPTRFFEGVWPEYHFALGSIVPKLTGIFDIHFIRPEGEGDVWYMDVMRWT